MRGLTATATHISTDTGILLLTRVTLLLTTMKPTMTHLVTNAVTRPHFMSTASRFRGLFAAAAADVHSLRTGRAGTGMAKQHALVAASAHQRLATHLTARVRNDPWIYYWIFFFAAIAVVARRALSLLVLFSTFWTEIG